MKRSDLSTRYVLFVVDYVGANAWDVLSAAVPPKVALAAIKREVDAGNLDYGVWLGRPFLTPQGRAKLAELSRPQERQSPDRHTADPGCKRNPSVAGSSFAFALAARGLVAITGNACCGGNGVEASCEVCRRD